MPEEPYRLEWQNLPDEWDLPPKKGKRKGKWSLADLRDRLMQTYSQSTPVPAAPRGTGGTGLYDMLRSGGYGPFKAVLDRARQGREEKSPLEALLERLNSFDGGGPVTFAAPDRAAYMRPYDEAERRANEAYQAAVPELKQLYGELDQRLAANRDVYQQDRDALVGEREAQRAARLAEAEAAVGAPAQAAMFVDGVEGAPLQEDAARQAAVDDLKAQYDAELVRQGMMDRSHANAERMTADQADTMEANSAAVARNNLDAILHQIGIGRADAERAYQDDLRSTQAANQRAQQEWRQQQRAQVERELDTFLKMQQSLAAMATTSGRKQLEEMLNNGLGSSRYPAAWRATEEIIKMAGKGPSGRVRALQILNERADDLADGDRNPSGKSLKPDVMRQWIEMWYDDEERIDPKRFQALGGDPKALGFLEGGISNPAVMRLLLGG